MWTYSSGNPKQSSEAENEHDMTKYWIFWKAWTFLSFLSAFFWYPTPPGEQYLAFQLPNTTQDWLVVLVHCLVKPASCCSWTWGQWEQLEWTELWCRGSENQNNETKVAETPQSWGHDQMIQCKFITENNPFHITHSQLVHYWLKKKWCSFK